MLSIKGSLARYMVIGLFKKKLKYWEDLKMAFYNKTYETQAQLDAADILNNFPIGTVTSIKELSAKLVIASRMCANTSALTDEQAFETVKVLTGMKNLKIMPLIVACNILDIRINYVTDANWNFIQRENGGSNYHNFMSMVMKANGLYWG